MQIRYYHQIWGQCGALQYKTFQKSFLENDVIIWAQYQKWNNFGGKRGFITKFDDKERTFRKKLLKKNSKMTSRSQYQKCFYLNNF